MEFLETNSVRNLRPGPYGILEPAEGEVAEKLDVIICPGLAFTPEGARLGQGGGFYDRALARYPAARKIGVAFACQILPSLPCENTTSKWTCHHIIRGIFNSNSGILTRIPTPSCPNPKDAAILSPATTW